MAKEKLDAVRMKLMGEAIIEELNGRVPVAIVIMAGDEHISLACYGPGEALLEMLNQATVKLRSDLELARRVSEALSPGEKH